MKKKPIKFLPIILLSIFCFALPVTTYNNQTIFNKTLALPTPYFDSVLPQELWVDSVFESLSMDERIAQLFMIRVQSNKDESYYQTIEQLIKKHNLGGICFFQGTPQKQAELTNRFQSNAKTPILISIDGEWGLGMRLDGTISFPRQMTLGAIQDDRLIYLMGVEIARQLKRIGIHMNFAPVVDVNSNAKNPVINTRSFGECKYNVSKKGIAYMKGMQDYKVIAVAKHFPGHGDTDTDSHFTLPVILHSKQRLDSLELFPFKQLINNGLQSIMVAHLNIPAYISDANTASTLSDSIVTFLLKKELNFDGLVVTDALDMKGVSNYFKPGTIELQALKAGNDILLLPQDVNVAIKSIKDALLHNEITEDLINISCKKILKYKYIAGLSNVKPINLNNIDKELNTVYAENLKKELIQNAITLVRNENNVIPISKKSDQKWASLAIGDGQGKHFQQLLADFTDMARFQSGKSISKTEIDNLTKRLSTYDRVFISLHNTSSLPQRRFGVTSQSVELINSIKKQTQVVLIVFGNPYILSFFKDTVNMDVVVVGYQDDKYAHEAVADIITGKLGASGRLPVTASTLFPLNTGIRTGVYAHLDYAEPSFFGIKEQTIKKIDSIAELGITEKAYPGAQILFAKDGKVFYHKAFGHHTYDSILAVKNSDLYDIASVTKIMSTTLALMKLYDEGTIEPFDRLDKYLFYLQDNEKGKIKIIDILGHQAKFKSWIPFYTATLINKKPNPEIYKTIPDTLFSLKVAENLYMNKTYYDTILKVIIETPLNRSGNYLYSDLGFYFLREVVETITKMSLEQYVYTSFYQPLGLTNTLYNPLDKFSKERIVPSEIDTYFRHQIIHGYVNDQGAAMTGGIGPHAGLFSNSWDLAVLSQMLLNEGTLNGITFFSNKTVTDFTKRHFISNNNNRRGLGFDKPLINGGDGGPVCKSASQSSYGHSGFTGTYVWIDPKHQLTYVFLSNRTYPDPENRKISRLNIRTAIHQLVYDALENK